MTRFTEKADLLVPQILASDERFISSLYGSDGRLKQVKLFLATQSLIHIQSGTYFWSEPKVRVVGLDDVLSTELRGFSSFTVNTREGRLYISARRNDVQRWPDLVLDAQEKYRG